MSDIAIRVEALGKRYRIGELQRYKALRDTLTDALYAPFGRIRSIFQRSNVQRRNDSYIWALKDVSFEVKQSEVVGIIGRNGAGKSTLLKILSRITEPTEGSAQILGRVGSLLEVGTGFHPELTGRENIYLNGAILGMKKRELDAKFDEIVTFAEVEKFIDTPIKHYSSGMYVRLAFAVAAHLEPEILLVDEVLAVGDAAFQKKCLGKMGDVAREGRTVVFVSHNMAAVQALCAEAILLDDGRVSELGHVGKIVNAYMREIIYEPRANMSKVFPVWNQTYGICVNSCRATVEEDSRGHLTLMVEIEIESNRALRNIGVGLSLMTINGVLVSLLAPSVTNYVIDEVKGRSQYVFLCAEVDKYLAGGDYIVGVWLSKPRTEYLVRVDQADVISVPPRDVFSSGTHFEGRSHGVVPLPLRFLTRENSGHL